MLCLYDREDLLGAASCRDSLIQLDLGSRGPAAAIRANGTAMFVPGLAARA
jgi:hypothetical protein